MRSPALSFCALVAALLLISAFFLPRGQAAPGDNIDSGFNVGGAGADNTLEAVAVQPDGKILERHPRLLYMQ